MKPKPQVIVEPGYSHLLELLDRAASLRRAIGQAESVLHCQELTDDERSALEPALESSRERLAQIVSALQADEGEAVEISVGEIAAASPEWSEQDLLEASRAMEHGCEEAEREVARAIESIGRSLRLSARDSIETFLTHHSPLLRAASMKVLTLHWRLREYTDRVLWSLVADTEPDCRRAAALCLGRLYEGTRDEEIGRELASVLSKESEEEDIRWASYYALLDLEGLERRQRRLGDFKMPPDVDRSLLEKYGVARARVDRSSE